MSTAAVIWFKSGIESVREETVAFGGFVSVLNWKNLWLEMPEYLRSH